MARGSFCVAFTTCGADAINSAGALKRWSTVVKLGFT
jgi:hypothetical protein